MGNTIGPFRTSESQMLATKLLNYFKGDIYFRDEDSIAECKALGVSCHETVLPDMALYEAYKHQTEDAIVVVPFLSDILTYSSSLIANVKELSTKQHLPVKLIVTQLWQWPIMMMTSLYFRFKEEGVDVFIVIPKDVNDLQQHLANAKMVISQNLHGLIMAYRAGTPVYSLQDKRKFKGFMNLIGKGSNMSALSQLGENSIVDAMSSKQQYQEQHFAQPIAQAFEGFQIE